METSYIVHRIARYDLQGKEMLKTLEKYFAGDHGFIYALLGIKDRLISGVLENIVMLELKRRGYRVFTGKWRDKEIDFVAEKQNKKLYIQVTWDMPDEETRMREFCSLLSVRDNYPKAVVTFEPNMPPEYEGIRIIPAWEWTDWLRENV